MGLPSRPKGGPMECIQGTPATAVQQCIRATSPPLAQNLLLVVWSSGYMAPNGSSPQHLATSMRRASGIHVQYHAAEANTESGTGTSEGAMRIDHSHGRNNPAVVRDVHLHPNEPGVGGCPEPMVSMCRRSKPVRCRPLPVHCMFPLIVDIVFGGAPSTAIVQVIKGIPSTPSKCSFGRMLLGEQAFVWTLLPVGKGTRSKLA